MTKNVFQKIFYEIKGLKYRSYHSDGWHHTFYYDYENLTVVVNWRANNYQDEKKGIACISWQEKEELTKEQEEDMFLYRKPPKCGHIIETYKMKELKESVKNLPVKIKNALLTK